MNVSIYALIDPRTWQVRYVGKTSRSLKKRLENHFSDRPHLRKTRWLNSLKRVGLKPVSIILKNVDESNCDAAEVGWIGHYRATGADLTNLTVGGDGVCNPSSESRRRLSEARKKLFQDADFKARMLEVARNPERIAKISGALVGKKHSKAHTAQLPQNQKGRKFSDEHRSKISKSLIGNKRRLGKPLTQAAKQKISDKLRGNTHTLGRKMPAREKIVRSLALRGKPKSEAWKAKARISALKRWERERQERMKIYVNNQCETI